MTHSPIDRAIDAPRRHLGDGACSEWEPVLRGFATLDGSEPALRAISQAPSEEEVRDRLAEVGFIALFLHLEFELEIEPTGRKGADLQVTRHSATALVEITRFRRMHDGPIDLSIARGDPRLGEYGDIDRDWGKAHEKILKKLRQVRGDTSIIAIWNDDGDLEEIEVELAVNGLVADHDAGRTPLPEGLMFVLYGSRWVSGATGKQFYVFPVAGDGLDWAPLFRFARQSDALDALARRAEV